MENQKIASAAAFFGGYKPITRCCCNVSQAAVEGNLGACALIAYEMVSMGLDSGSTSDRHRTSGPTTVSTPEILRCSIPFVT